MNRTPARPLRRRAPGAVLTCTVLLLFLCRLWAGAASPALTHLTATRDVTSPVPNDFCSGALLITGTNYTYTQSTTAATSQGDPAPSCVSNFGNGVWFQFTPPTAGQLVVDTAGSSFDTGLGFYSGTCEALTELGCNDDSNGTLQSSLNATVTAGTTYYFLAGGWHQTNGNLVFHLAFTPRDQLPANITVITQPASQTLAAGNSATFSVQAESDLPLTYAWRRGGALLPGATTASYTLSAVQLADSGAQFDCLLGNSAGRLLSSNAVLTVYAAGSDLVTFDDLPGTNAPVPAGYHGLTQWDNLECLDGANSPSNSGFHYGWVSASNGVYNAEGTPARLSRGRPFNLVSAYLTAAWNDQLQLQVLGYVDATLAYSNTYVLSATTPTQVHLHYDGVTEVDFIPSGGTPHPGYDGAGTQFMMDDVQLETPPEVSPVFLSGNYLYVPIQTNGVFLACETGIRFNPAGTGGTAGVDFWQPGAPIYNLIIGLDGLNYLSANAPLVSGFTTLSVSNLSSGPWQRAYLSGTVVLGLHFSRDISFATNSRVIRIVDTLQNTGPSSFSNLVILDTADPDPDITDPAYPTYETLNDVVSVNRSNDLVVATGPNDGLSVGFGSDSGLQIPSAAGFNNTDAFSYLSVVDPDGASYDVDLNLAQNYGTLAPGQSRSVAWYILFGASKTEVLNAFRPRFTAVECRAGTNFWAQLWGPEGAECTLQASTNLVQWVDLSTQTVGPTGLCEVLDPEAGQYPCRYYRVVPSGRQ